MKTSIARGFVAPLLLIIIVLLALGGGTYYYAQKSKTSQVPASATATATTTALISPKSGEVNQNVGIVFITPVESESLIRGSSHVIIWDGIYSGNLALKVVSTPIGSTISSIVSDSVFSLNKRNQIVWNISCNFDNSQGWYKLVFADKYTDIIVAESPPFIVSREQTSSCTNAR